MSDHREVFAAHFKSYLRKRYPSHLFCNVSWVQGACEAYSADTGIELDIIVGVANGGREPNIRMMEDLGVIEYYETVEEVVPVQVKFYRSRKGDRLS